MHYIFTGNFGGQLPFYLRKENFGRIKENISALKLKQGLIQEFITEESNFKYCNFSNIFEYMSKEEFSKFHQLLLKNLPNGAIISYWNLMVDSVFQIL
ncbi:MAG: hypothetical protein HC912_08610 [Saprospiraceae bacterium]|nr:hypothetical protein [Saprospiraceae bacterium]